MARLELRLFIRATPERVWEVISDLHGQKRWMADLRSLEITSEHRDGPGTEIDVTSELFGLPLVKDKMADHRLGAAVSLRREARRRVQRHGVIRAGARAQRHRLHLDRGVQAAAGQAGRAGVLDVGGAAPAQGVPALDGQRQASGGGPRQRSEASAGSRARR